MDSTSERDRALVLFGTPKDVAVQAAVGSGMPHLVAEGNGALLSWLEPVEAAERDGAWRLATAHLDGDTWSEPSVVTERSGMFINWADFPSVQTSGSHTFAHWLQRGPAGGYDYSIQMAVVDETDPSWHEGAEREFTLHEDTSPVEHGFVSAVPLPGDRLGVVWLDGRDFTGDDPHEMQVRFREVSADGSGTEETLLDSRACDCCQTDLTVAGNSLVAAYRDRSPEEIRDISVVRRTETGWSDPVTVHEDGWHIEGCPVNGPALDADGDVVAVAWFTAADDEPRVNLAFSMDGGRSFAPPVRIDHGAPLGRVDVSLLGGSPEAAAAGSTSAASSPVAAVSWLERSGEGAAQVRIRAATGGHAGSDLVIGSTSSARSSGFPQMIRLGSSLWVAWTDTGADMIRTARVDVAPEKLP